MYWNAKISKMVTMKFVLILISLAIASALIILPFSALAATTADGVLNASATQNQVLQRTTQVPVKTVITQSQTPQRRSGEVEFPRTPHPTPTPTVSRPTVTPTQTIPRTTATATPTIPHTTISATPTIPPTTVSATQTVPPTTIPVTTTIPVPVVTVTILVYPPGNVYQPLYYYPPYYPYPINSYYPTGSITVTSNPSSAAVILDGYNTGTTPWIFTGLTTGYHTVEIDYPGYEAYVTNVYVDDGANPSVYADLTNLVSYGSLFVDSTPRGADVYVDGNYQGTSAVTVGGLSAGPHQVELHLAGYEVLTTTETVSSGQGTVVNLVLTPLSTFSDDGSIDITSATSGALIYLDGIYKGSIISGTTFSIISVSPGSHTILIHAPGYTDIIRTVQVDPGQIATVDASSSLSYPVGTTAGLQGSASQPPGPGSIVVTSTPAGGQVTVDNQFRGVAPVTIYNVATGNHIINMKLAGYSDWSSSVDVPPNQMAQVHATLSPGSGTMPVPTKPGLSPFAILGAFAIVAFVVAYRLRK
jgi:hypothetical protein